MIIAASIVAGLSFVVNAYNTYFTRKHRNGWQRSEGVNQ